MASGGLPEVADFTAIPASDYFTDTMATMWQHQQEALFTDCVIKVKDKAIPCHRVVVSAASPYFKAALTSEFKNANKGQIYMEDVNSELMINVVRYLYGQKAVFSQSCLISLVEVCNLLNLDHLKNQVRIFLSENLSIDKCLNSWKFGMKYGMDELRKKSVLMMSKDIGTIGASEEFKGLTIEELMHILKDEDLEMESRDNLLIACVEWVDYQPVVRKDNMIDIVKHIQLEKCSVEILNTVHKKYADLTYNVAVLNVILNDSFRRQLLGHIGNMAKHIVILGGMIGGYSGEINNTYLMAKPDGPFEWKEFIQIPPNVQTNGCPIVCLEDGFLVLCGGAGKNKTTRYDARRKIWADLPNCPKSPEIPSAVFCDNSVYVLGGQGPLDSVLRLDLSTLTWQEEPNMLEKQRLPISAVLEKTIYVVYNNPNGVKERIQLQEFNTNANKSWAYKASVPNEASKTEGANLVASKDTLYLVGGRDKIAARYSVATDTWALLKTPSLPHYYGASVLHDGQIYIMGSCEDNHRNASVYSIEKDKWAVVATNLAYQKFSFFNLAVVSWL